MFLVVAVVVAADAELDDIDPLMVSFARPNMPILICYVRMIGNQLVVKYLLLEVD